MDNHITTDSPYVPAILDTLGKIPTNRRAEYAAIILQIANAMIGTGASVEAVEAPEIAQETVAAEAQEVTPAPPKRDGKPPKLQEKHRRVLRRLRKGEAKGQALADLVDVSLETIHRWCSPTKKGNVLYRVGVRGTAEGYAWPNPDIEVCGTERDGQ